MALTPPNEVKTVTMTPLPEQSTNMADWGGGLGEQASSAPPAPHLALVEMRPIPDLWSHRNG